VELIELEPTTSSSALSSARSGVLSDGLKQAIQNAGGDERSKMRMRFEQARDVC